MVSAKIEKRGRWFGARRASSLRDDRGVDFAFEPEEFHANTREGVARPRFENAWMWLGGAVLVYIIVRAVLDPKPLWPLHPGWWTGAVMGLLGGRLTTYHASSPRHDRVRSATALAFGFCGRCGYALAELPTEPDGCRTCAECGASWNAERITFGIQTRQAAFNRMEAFNGYHVTAVPSTDDRGVVLAQRYGWPDQRVIFVPPAAEPTRERLGAIRWRRTRTLVVAVWVVWPLTVAALALRNGDIEALDVFVAVLGATVVSALALAVPLSAHRVRSVVLEDGRCPGCWNALTRTPVQFDGCCICSQCKAAWRVADVGGGRPPSPAILTDSGCGTEGPA